MGILERIASARGEQRYSADHYLTDYVIPFQYGGMQYGVPGANGLVQTLAGNRSTEIVNSLPGYAAALRQCPPAFAAQLVRAMVLSQARFCFRNRSTRKTFTNTRLGPLEKPWTGATTGELIARMEWHAGLAGNAFTTRQNRAGRPRLRVLRPDWVAIVYGSDQEPEDAAHALDGEVIGYVYQNGGLWSDRGRPTVILPEDMAHWSPIPDPEAAGAGQSWITPAIRDMQQDRLAGEHTIRFFENGATPNLVVKGIPAATKTQFDDLVEMMESKHSGVANAYKSLYLTAGADASIVGANLADLDLKSVHGSAETRISALSRVHPVILGIAEGLAGSSLNAGNFGQAKRIWADTWIYPSLQDLSASLAPIIDVPADAELWFDAKDIPLLREDGKDAADIASTQAQTIRTLLDAGYTPDSVQSAVQAQDWSLLKHTGLFSVQLQPPGSQQATPGPPTAGPPTRPPAKPVRHRPGKHNQQSHGDGTGAAQGALAGNRQRFKPGRGAFGSSDVEANAMIVDGSGGRELRLGVISSLADDDGDVWDGNPERSDTVALSRRGLRRLRNDLDEGRTRAKTALADDPDNSGRLAEGETAGVKWEMYGEDLAPFSTSVSIDADGDGVVLDPKQLDRFLGWLDDLDGQLADQPA